MIKFTQINVNYWSSSNVKPWLNGLLFMVYDVNINGRHSPRLPRSPRVTEPRLLRIDGQSMLRREQLGGQLYGLPVELPHPSAGHQPCRGDGQLMAFNGQTYAKSGYRICI